MLEAERGRHRLRRRHDAALRPRAHRARRARRAGCTCSARSRSRRRRRTRAAWSAHARELRRVLFPCHNYKHAPVIKAVRQVLDAGLIGQVQLVTLQTFRNTHAQGRRRVAPRLAARAALLGRRHRDGPREPHLLSRVRLARRVPHGHHREDVDARRLRHRGQLRLRDDVPERDGDALTSRGPRASARSSTPSTASAAPSASRTTTSRSPS